MRRLLVFAVWLLAAQSARADEDVWAVAQRSLSAPPVLVARIDGAKWLRSPLGRGLLDWQLKVMSRPGRLILEELWTTLDRRCGIDLGNSIGGIVGVVTEKGPGGILYVSTPTLDAKGLADCLGRASAKAGGIAVKPADADGIVELRKKNQQIFVAWPSAHVIAFVMDPTDRGNLIDMLGHKELDRSAAIWPALQGVRAGAAVWLAATSPAPPLRYIYGNGDVVDGRFIAELHLVHDAPDKAAELGPEALRWIKGLVPRAAEVPPAIAAVLAAVEAKTSRTEITLTSSVSVASLLELLPARQP